MIRNAIFCAVIAAVALSGCGRSAPDDASSDVGPTTSATSSTTTTEVVVTQPTTTVERFTGSEETYIVAQGDAFSLIAAKFNVSSEKLAEFNDISDPNLIKVGQTIYLPPGSEAVVVTTAPPASAETTEAPETSATFATVPASEG
jgi:LysM repeat protein